VISAAFVEHQPSAPAWFELTAKPALVNILEQMRVMEAMLSDAQRLKWTAARPGWLLDEPYTGEAVITDERLAEGCFRCRHADLAASLLDFVCEDIWINAKPAIGRPEAESAAIKAQAPGTTVTGIPASRTSFINRYPGSLIPGVPASVTNATDCPCFNRSSKYSDLVSSLCSK